MVTFNSCLIWQIISFILSSNEYGCVCTWTMLRSGPVIDLEKMPILAKKIIFSVKAHFDLGGYVNKQNRSIWGTENPHAYIEKPSHCLVRILIQRTFFFENEQGKADRYRAMLNEFLFTKIEEKDIGNICFQQDGATCHTAETALDVLRPVFEDPIISRRAEIVWPLRSYDLSPVGLLFVRCRQR